MNWKILVTFLIAAYKFLRSGCEKVSERDRNRRYAICKSCELLKNHRCTNCGCWVSLKTWCATEHCPIFKW